MIDTLILSGGGPSGIAYVGIFGALMKNEILIKSDLKEIITTSVGIIFAILYLLDYTTSQIEKIVLETELDKLLNTDDLEIDNLLLRFGLFDNKTLGNSIQSFIKHKHNKNDLTLNELYDIIPIKLNVKVYNIDLGKTEYFSYLNQPDIKLSTLSMMTTAIPYIFQPIKYNDNLYVDGGLKGHFPIEVCESDNYLGIRIRGGTCNPDKYDFCKDFPILGYTIKLMASEGSDTDISNYDKDKIFIYDINSGLNFTLNQDEKQKLIEKGYNMTIDYLKQRDQ